MRIFIDIGAFEPDQTRLDQVRARLEDGQFELEVPSRASPDERRSYVVRETAERVLDWLVPTLLFGLILGLWSGWGLFWWVLAVAAVVGVGIGVWVYRRVDHALEPLGTDWTLKSNGRSFHLYRTEFAGIEEALSTTLQGVGTLSSHGVADSLMRDYLHDRCSNELKLSSERGTVRFAEGLDFETCERVVTKFNTFVQKLREEKRIDEVQTHG